MNAGIRPLNSILKGAAPPETVGLEVEVVRILTCSPRQFVLLSEQAWGAWHHWVGRSVKCQKPKECERCKRSNAKWRGYIHALEFLPNGLKKNVILELTLSAISLIDLQLCTQPLRGTNVKLSKTKGGKHGRFVVEVLQRRVDHATLIDSINPEGLMCWLWEKNEAWDGPKPEEQV